MSAWIPISTGLLAFAGVIFGQIVASDLNTAAKRRDVRRGHIERMTDLLNEDVSWMREYERRSLFLPLEMPTFALGPYYQASAIFQLYFHSELSAQWGDLADARGDLKNAIEDAVLIRVNLAGRSSERNSALTPEQTRPVLEKDRHYYSCFLDVVERASQVAQETIPEESQLKKAWSAASAKLASLLKRG